MNRSRLLLVVILVAVAALAGSLWVGEGPLWRMVMLVEMPYEDLTRGTMLCHRVTGKLFQADVGGREGEAYREGGSMKLRAPNNRLPGLKRVLTKKEGL